MNLYYLVPNIKRDYDTYDGMIVAAESEYDARQIHPDGNSLPHWNSWGESTWATSPDTVTAELIGTATEGTEQGIILASFNAG